MYRFLASMGRRICTDLADLFVTGNLHDFRTRYPPTPSPSPDAKFTFPIKHLVYPIEHRVCTLTRNENGVPRPERASESVISR